MKHNFHVPAALALALFVAACQAPAGTSPMAPAGVPAAASAPFGQTALVSGRVDATAKTRALMASVEDFAANATVTLYQATPDMDQRAYRLAGRWVPNTVLTPRSSGLAAADGSFTLYRPTVGWTPKAGEYFVLEATRRSASVFDRKGYRTKEDVTVSSPEGSRGDALLSLRTILRFNGTKFESIAGDSNEVSAQTTAVSQLTMEGYFFGDDRLLMDYDPAAEWAASFSRTINLLATGGTLSDTQRTAVEVRASAVLNLLRADIDPNQANQTSSANVRSGKVAVITGYGEMEKLRNVSYLDGDLVIYLGGSVDQRGNYKVQQSLQLNLPHLERVTGDVIIIGLGGATTLEGLGSLRSIGGDLRIHDPNLTSLKGLEGLTSVEGDLEIRPVHVDGRTVYSYELDSLGRASGYRLNQATLPNPNMMCVMFPMTCMTPTPESTVTPTPEATATPTPEPTPTPTPPASLMDVSGLKHAEVQGQVTFADLPGLQGFGGLKLGSVRGLSIVGCANLTSLAGLGLTRIYDGFFVAGCPALTSYAALDDVEFGLNAEINTELEFTPVKRISEFVLEIE